MTCSEIPHEINSVDMRERILYYFLQKDEHSDQKEKHMPKEKLPKMYTDIRKRYPELSEALEALGKAARAAGPLNEKTSHLVQLAAAAAIRSEGSVHSHVRRALEAGAKKEEIYHTLVLLTSTIGFPAVSAAISWTDDVIKKK